ncbi:MAG TPA: hypothetical protein VLJ39_06170, partial [Tepidisphaeraceae bacterium]|nr:hypothetical protein [Tepidisphaeraceae bacterium]
MHVAITWARWLVFALILLASAEAAAAAEGHVYKFTSGRRLNVAGRDHLVVIAEPPSGGHSLRLVVANTDENKYSPPPEIADAIKGFRQGNLVQVQTTAEKDLIHLESVSGWSPRPGEETPHGYVYIQSGGTDKPGELHVTLSKYMEMVEFIVPPDKDAQGNPAPNPAIDSELKQVHEGDVVWADVLPGKPPALAAILPWADPQQGKLVRVGPADVDGQKGFAAEISTDSKPITALIPMKQQNGRWIPDPRIMTEAQKPTRGTDVLFRTRE